MRTYENWLQEATTGDLKAMGATPAQIDKLKQRRAQRGYGFDSNDDRSKNAPAKKPGALVKRPESRGVSSQDKPGALTKSKGSSLSTRPADKAGAIVKAKKASSNDASSNDDKQVGSRPGTSRPTGGDDFGKPVGGGWSAGRKPRMDPKKKFDKRVAGIKSALGKAAGAVANSARGTIQDKGEKMQDAKVTPVKRGLYNP